MKKIFLLSLISLVIQVILLPELYSISLAEYIRQNGIPKIIDGRLDLANKNLTDITDLKNISHIDQITYLDLSNNQLEALPPDIFRGLTNLEYLLLHDNRLKNLSATVSIEILFTYYLQIFLIYCL